MPKMECDLLRKWSDFCGKKAYSVIWGLFLLV